MNKNRCTYFMSYTKKNTLQFSSFGIFLVRDFLSIYFIILWYVLSRNTLGFVKGFFSKSIKLIMWLLFLGLIIYVIKFIDLKMLSHPCILGIKTTLFWCLISSMYYWVWIASIYRVIWFYIINLVVLLQPPLWNSLKNICVLLGHGRKWQSDPWLFLL